jgi:hypothetical protein
MNSFLRILPWVLLAMSLVAHLRVSPRDDASVHVEKPASVAASRPVYSETVVPAETHPIAPVPQTQPVAESASAPKPGVTFANYADLLAYSLETPEQHTDLARVLARWIAVDPAAASAWLARQPDDPRYDLPVAQIVTHLTARTDYPRAREWADSIRTPAVRAAAIEEILAEQYRHRRVTPEALTLAAAQAGLTPERVQAILNYSRLD